jgi:hypothetical protein
MFGAAKRRRRRAENDRSSLGNIRVDLGYCSRPQVHQAVAEQSEAEQFDVDLPLGRLLIDANIITQDQLEQALLRQRVLRGQSDPNELKRYGTGGRIDAFGKVADRFRGLAESAGMLAQKAKG